MDGHPDDWTPAVKPEAVGDVLAVVWHDFHPDDDDPGAGPALSALLDAKAEWVARIEECSPDLLRAHVRREVAATFDVEPRDLDVHLAGVLGAEVLAEAVSETYWRVEHRRPTVARVDTL